MPINSPAKITFGKDNTFVIEFSGFYQGYSPMAHLDSLTEIGNGGSASVMQNVDIISKPGLITQGPALADLTNGTQAGVVSELIHFIMDQPTADGVAYAAGASKLFQLSNTTVSSGGTPSWPVTVTNMSNDANFEPGVVLLLGKLFTFFNKSSSGGDISTYNLASTFDHDYGSTTPTVPSGGSNVMTRAPHPVAKKEDTIVFGNGQYLGTLIYVDGTSNDTLNTRKLDFGNDAIVADVVWHANQWLIAVNYGVTGTNRNQSQILIYDGSATASILDDEAAVGLYKIGFLLPIGGVVFVAYQDLSSDNYIIGYISGRKLNPIGYFTGSLPGFHQKTLYKNTILFIANGLVWSCGAVTEDLPYQTSQLADGGHATVGALAAPFGTPIVASNTGSSYRLAKFDATPNYDITGNWKSVVIPLVVDEFLGYIEKVIVLTKNLSANAKCLLKFDYNQAQSTTTAVNITGTSKRMHVFTGKDFNFSAGGIEDVRLFLDWSSGNATNDCAIRKVLAYGRLV